DTVVPRGLSPRKPGYGRLRYRRRHEQRTRGVGDAAARIAHECAEEAPRASARADCRSGGEGERGRERERERGGGGIEKKSERYMTMMMMMSFTSSMSAC